MPQPPRKPKKNVHAKRVATLRVAEAAAASEPYLSFHRILVYHGKQGDQYWLADTPARLDAALRQLFLQLDAEELYEEGERDLAEARAGHSVYIRSLLERHRTREYENWEIAKVEPCTS
jgi:hypothetical protein